MTDINIPLLRKVLEHVTEHPEEWDQAVWARKMSCGTAYCVAGHVAVMTGHKVRFQGIYASVTTEGRAIMAVAAEELGLDERQAEVLFEGRNTLSHLWEYANYITDGEIEMPESLKYV